MFANLRGSCLANRESNCRRNYFIRCKKTVYSAWAEKQNAIIIFIHLVPYLVGAVHNNLFNLYIIR